MRRAAAVALAGAALTLAAYAFDAAPLFAVGGGFLLIGLGIPAVMLTARRGASVRREFGTVRVIEGEPVSATIVLGCGPLGLPGALLHDPAAPVPLVPMETPEGTGPLRLRLGVRLRREREIPVPVRFARRGRHGLAPPGLVLTDPLGLVTVRRTGAEVAQEVLVLPRTEPVRWRLDARARRRIGLDAGTAEDPFDAADIDGLRPYRTGTPASRIHWQALARGQGLQERRLRADAHSRPVIVLDARAPRDVSDEEAQALLDAAVRATASLTLELARAGGCRLLLPGDRRPAAIESDLRGWPALHVRLALIGEPGEGGGPVMSAPARVSAAAGLFYVVARATRMPAAVIGSARGGIAALVIPAGLARVAQPPSFTVSGCEGFAQGAGAARGSVPRRVPV